MVHYHARPFQTACRLVLLAVALGVTLPQTPAAIAQTSPRLLKADLDGDGTPETVKLTTTRGANDEQSFTLTVNVATVTRKLELEADVEMKIIDVDRSDKFKEVLIQGVGASDYSYTFVYHYDGKALIEILKAEGQGGVEFSGNGIALQSDWMGFWTRKRKHQLDNTTQRFREVPQEIYYVGIEGKVKETFPVYERRGATTVVANTRAGSTMLVVACDPSPHCTGDTNDACHWYLIKTETGLLGWVRLETLRDKAELPWAG